MQTLGDCIHEILTCWFMRFHITEQIAQRFKIGMGGYFDVAYMWQSTQSYNTSVTMFYTQSGQRIIRDFAIIG